MNSDFENEWQYILATWWSVCEKCIALNDAQLVFVFWVLKERNMHANSSKLNSSIKSCQCYVGAYLISHCLLNTLIFSARKKICYLNHLQSIRIQDFEFYCGCCYFRWTVFKIICIQDFMDENDCHEKLSISKLFLLLDLQYRTKIWFVNFDLWNIFCVSFFEWQI